MNIAAPRVEQSGTPEDIYLRPATLRVAESVGDAMVLRVGRPATGTCTRRLDSTRLPQRHASARRLRSSASTCALAVAAARSSPWPSSDDASSGAGMR